MQRLFPAHLEAIAAALANIFGEGAYADREIAKVLKADKRRGSKDRAFIAENTYEVVRNYRLLRHLAGGGKPKSREDWWRIVGIQLALKGVTLPPWTEFREINTAELQQKWMQLSKTVPSAKVSPIGSISSAKPN